jgi:16S rRNA (uracil1498-N3)-methyltransferase
MRVSFSICSIYRFYESSLWQNQVWLRTENYFLTRRRWIADEVHGSTAALTGDHAAHLVRVLRAEVGQQFDIATGKSVRLGKITSIAPDRVEFSLGEERPVPADSRITLALAIFKFDRMEWAIEKCTELGVGSVIPLIAARTDSHLAQAAAKRRERWQRIARQASEQSRRSAPMEIGSPVKLKELAVEAECRIVLAESEQNTLLRDALPASANEVTLAVGPEGGWTTDELAWFQKTGWSAASLGNTILRAETAAIVSAALAIDILR